MSISLGLALSSALTVTLCMHYYLQSLRPGHTDPDSGHTKFKRVRQFGRTDCAFPGYTDRAFGHTKSR